MGMQALQECKKVSLSYVRGVEGKWHAHNCRRETDSEFYASRILKSSSGFQFSTVLPAIVCLNLNPFFAASKELPPLSSCSLPHSMLNRAKLF